mmetsp:Transcript_5704/g.8407  ORF Transcript_5704/g.8407 Transcript_5704/m.8407 type:complete len:546 (+) Transcript_5704:42-1679(+)
MDQKQSPPEEIVFTGIGGEGEEEETTKTTGGFINVKKRFKKRKTPNKTKLQVDAKRSTAMEKVQGEEVEVNSPQRREPQHMRRLSASVGGVTTSIDWDAEMEKLNVVERRSTDQIVMGKQLSKLSRKQSEKELLNALKEELIDEENPTKVKLIEEEKQRVDKENVKLKQQREDLNEELNELKTTILQYKQNNQYQKDRIRQLEERSEELEQKIIEMEEESHHMPTITNMTPEIKKKEKPVQRKRGFSLIKREHADELEKVKVERNVAMAKVKQLEFKVEALNNELQREKMERQYEEKERDDILNKKAKEKEEKFREEREIVKREMEMENKRLKEQFEIAMISYEDKLTELKQLLSEEKKHRGKLEKEKDTVNKHLVNSRKEKDTLKQNMRHVMQKHTTTPIQEEDNHINQLEMVINSLYQQFKDAQEEFNDQREKEDQFLKKAYQCKSRKELDELFMNYATIERFLPLKIILSKQLIEKLEVIQEDPAHPKPIQTIEEEDALIDPITSISHPLYKQLLKFKVCNKTRPLAWYQRFYRWIIQRLKN